MNSGISITWTRKRLNRWILSFGVMICLMMPQLPLRAQNYAVAFDGSGDYISIPADPNWAFGTGNFTISFWMSLNNLNLIHDGLFGREDYQWLALEYNHDGDHRLNLWIDQNGSYGWDLNNMKSNKNDWVTGTWYHIAIVRSGNQIRMYIDGLLDKTATYSATVFNPSSPLYFGRSQLANRFHNGSMDDIRIYNYALDEAELASQRFSELSGNELGLLAYWNLNDGLGTVVSDKTPYANHGTLMGDAVYISSTAPVLQNNSATLPFAPVQPSGLPYSVIITSALIDGVNLPAGSSIGLYEGNLCVGAANYNPSGNTQIIAWKGDPSQGLPGFTIGSAITMKVRTEWFSEIEIFDPTVTFTVGNGTYGFGVYTVAGLSINTGLLPGIVLSDTLLNFNALTVSNSLSDTIILSNNGTAILSVSSIACTPNVFTVNKSSTQVLPGSADTLVVTFTPAAVSVYAGSLTMNTDHPDFPQLQVDLHGSGLPVPSPEILVNPGFLSFGGLVPGDTASLKFSVINGGNGSLQITSITSTNPAFIVNSATSFSLAQSMNKEIEILFIPTIAQSYGGNIQVNSNDGNVLIPVSGFAGSGYFQSVSPTGLPYMIVIEDIMIDGLFTPGSGDEIAVYDDTLCVGTGGAVGSGMAATFDGNGDYFYVPINVSETSYTVEMWFRSNSPNGGLFSVTNGGHDRHIYLSNGNIYTRVYSNEVINTSGINFADGNWHHVAHTFGGTQGGQKIYVDGVLRAQGSKSYSDFNWQGGVHIGYSEDMGYLNGQIDEVRIWSTARTHFQIVSDMQTSYMQIPVDLQAYFKFEQNSFDFGPNNYVATTYGDVNYAASQAFPGGVILLNAWQEDQSLGLPGFTIGDSMSFKLRMNLFNSMIEIPLTPVYTQGNGNFGDLPYTVVSLTGSSQLDPVLSFSSTNLYIGQAQVNQTVSTSFTIYNTGNASASLFLSESSTQFSISYPANQLAAGDSMLVTVSFAPTTSGNHTTQIVVETDDPQMLETIVEVSGFALPSGVTNIDITPENLNFNGVVIGETKSLSFHTINIGTAPLIVSSISSNHPAFTVSPSNFTLGNTNDNQLITVNFTPGSKGQAYGIITINSNSTTAYLYVSGVGYDGYFESIDPTGIPYTILIQDNNLAEEISVGDEIGIFDGELCVGSAAVLPTGNSLSLDGTGDYLGVSNSPSLNLNGSSLTFEAWIYPKSYTSDLIILNKESTYEFHLDEGGRFEAAIETTAPAGWVYTSGNAVVPLNQWSYVAATYDGTSVRTYVNGVLDVVMPLTGTIVPTTAGLGVGARGLPSSPSAYFNGMIDEVALYSIVKTSEQIQSRMYSVLYGNEPGLIAYWNFNFTPGDFSSSANHGSLFGNANINGTQPEHLEMNGIQLSVWQADPSQSLPGYILGDTIQVRAWVDINGFESDLKGEPTILLGDGTFGYGYMTVMEVDFLLPQLEYDPEEFFVALDEPDSTTLSVSVSNIGEGSLIYQFKPGIEVSGKSLYLDGSGDYVSTGNWTAGSQWTIQAWVKPSSIPAGRRTIFGGYGSCLDWGITMQEGKFGISIKPPSECTQTIIAPFNASLNQWTHVTGTVDGSTARLYINGVLVASGPVQTNFSGVNSSIRIGGEACCSGNDFPGWVDELQVWNYARSSSEIVESFNRTLILPQSGLITYFNFDNGTLSDLSGTGHNGSFAGNALISQQNAPVLPQWIDFTLATDTLLSSASQNVSIHLNTTGLIEGLYETDVVILSNDPNLPVVEIPISLNVTGAAQISATPMELLFNNLIVGNEETKSFQLKNIGTDSLIIQSISLLQGLTSGMELLNLPAMPLVVAPLQQISLQVLFAPQTDGLKNDTVLIVSNASNEDSLAVILSGQGLTPAEIGLSENSWIGQLPSGQVLLDSFYIFNSGQANLLFDIQNSVPWLSLDPANGIVSVDDSVKIMMNISTIGVYAGSYQGSFMINSNDLQQTQLSFSMSLSVSGEPDLLSQSSVNFGIVNVGDAGIVSYTLINSGTDSLHIDSVQFSDPIFSLGGPGSLIIPPGQTALLSLVFVPQLAYSYSGIMTIYCDASSGSAFPIVLQGQGNLPPDLELSFDSVDVQANYGVALQYYEMISNQGGQPLQYQMSFVPAGGKSLSLDGNGDYLNVLNSATLNPDTALSIEAWIYPTDNNQEFIVAKEYSNVGSYRLYLDQSGKLKFQVNNQKLVTSLTTVPKNQWTHVAASTNGRVMQVFLNGVLDAEVTFTPFEIHSNTFNLRIGRSYLNEYFAGEMDELRIWGVYRNESEIAASMNQTMFGDEFGLVLYYGFNESGGNTIPDLSLQSNGATMYGNSTRKASTVAINQFVNLSPLSGTINQGLSQNLQFNFQTSGFSAGTYERLLNVSSNDPDQATFQVPVRMTISGDPLLTASVLSFQFDSIYLGQTAVLELELENAGPEPVLISDWVFGSEVFAADFEYQVVYPLSSKIILLSFEPAQAGLFEDTLRINSNAANSPILELPLSGFGLQPPSVDISQNLFVQTLNWGNSQSQSLYIYNSGDGPLNWTLSGYNPSWVSLSASSGQVAANDSVLVEITFDGENDGGSYQSNLILSSNDFTQPQLVISLSLSINGAIAELTENQLSNWVTYQEIVHDTIYLKNTGLGPLTYSLSESANWLIVSPLSGVVMMGDSAEIILTMDGNFPHGNYTTSLNLQTNDPFNTNLAVEVELQILHATLVSIPTNLSFGYSVVNIGSTKTLTLLNNGNVDLTIDSVYSVDPFSPATSENVFLAAGASLQVPVFFLPNATLIYNETITIATSIGNFTVPVHGIGQNPNPAWHYSWTMHDFGLTDCAVGASKVLTITNIGNVPWVMDDWDISSEYFTVSDTIFSLNPGQSKSITISFNPTAIEIYEGTLLWTTNAIGTKEILLDGRGFFLSQSPVLTYSDDPYYQGIEGISPLIGSTSTFFQYKVIYTDADNNPPMAGYPIVGIDRNGDADFLDSGEDEFEMFPVDATDVDYTDGKEYIFTTTLPLNFDLGYSFYAYDSLGNIPVGEATIYRDDPLVSDDLLDLSIYANDINFSDLTPEVGQVIQISATVHNNSDYPAESISVRFYEEDDFITELTIPYLGGQSQAIVSINHFFTIDEYYPIKVVIDEENFILEDNELNNFAIRPVLVGEFSIPGAIVATAHVSPTMVQPTNVVHWYGHADYVGSYDPNTNVSGAQVTMTIVQTGYTFTTYTNSNGDFSVYFQAPLAPGFYTITGTVTDFTLLANCNTVNFQVYIPEVAEPILGPDLAIIYWWGTDIHWTSECRRIGDPIEVNAIVTNIGNQTAYNALVHVMQDETLILNPVFDSIPAGTSKQITFTVNYASVGTHSVSVSIDPYNTIPELNEWNNFGSRSRWIYPLEPDLKPVYAWVSDQSPLQGQAVNFTFQLDNLECTTSSVVEADFYHIFGSDTTFIETQLVDPICATCYDYLYLYNRVYYEVGYHKILIVVDPDNQLAETNEANNALSIQFYVEQAIADLKISDISFSAYNPDMGDLINFTATIWNNGTADAEDFYVRFYMDNGEIGDSVHVALLPHGVNMLVTSDPWQVTECGHTVSATVDEENLIQETNEFNNQTSRPVGYDFVPSLWPFYYSSHINVLVGTPVTLRSRIYNNGTLDADTVFVSYVVNNTMIAYDGVPFIHHQSHSSSSHIYTFQNTGQYAVYIYADRIWPDSTRYCELDETNNVVVLNVTVYGEDPDLQVLSHHISPTELNPDPGEPIDIYGSFANVGNVPAGPFWIKFYMNSEQWGDSIYINGIGAHEDSTVACTLPFSSTQIGTHVIRMEVDVNHQVVEVSEQNNMASRAIIVGDAPDHTFSDYGDGIWLSDTLPLVGETITLNAIIENNGGATGTALLSYYYVFLGDTTFIESITYTAAPYDSTDIPIQWTVAVPYGKIVAKITNANPEEFNIFNNSTSIEFGNPAAPLTAQLSASAQIICLGESVNLSVTPGGGMGSYVVTWTSEPAGYYQTGNNVELSPEMTRIYRCTVEDGFQTVTSTISVQVVNTQVDLGSDLSVCSYDALTISAGNFAAYEWSNGASTSSITISEAGIYVLSVTDAYGCSDSDTIVVSFIEPPVVSLSGLQAFYCGNDEGSALIGSPAGGNFSGSGLNGYEFSPYGLNPGSYELSYTYTDNNGCSATATSSTVVYTLPEVSIVGLDAEYFSDDAADPIYGIPSGGTLYGSGTNGYWFDPLLAGPGVHVIYYEYTDTNFCTVIVQEITQVTTVYDISGNISYFNAAQDPMINAEVILKQGNSNLDTALSSAQGTFQFINRYNGIYQLGLNILQNPGGMNATDALLIRRHTVFLEPLTGLKLAAADVNASNTVTSADALLVLRKTVGYISTFPAGDWTYSTSPVTINNADAYSNVLTLCFGDVNGSFEPNGAKDVLIAQGLIKHGALRADDNEIIEIPLHAELAKPGALTLNLYIDPEIMHFVDLQANAEDAIWEFKNGILMLAMTDLEGIGEEDGELLRLKVELLQPGRFGEAIHLLAGSELADLNANPWPQNRLIIPEKLSFENAQLILYPNYPNPFKEQTTLSFYLPESMHVKIKLLNSLGMTIDWFDLGERAAGTHDIPFMAKSLSSGCYWIILEAENAENHQNASRILQIMD